MIIPPLNDHDCLAAIHDRILATGRDADATIEPWARRLGSRAAIVRWLRSLPQRDDTGIATDGPRVEACAPPQRLRLLPFPPDPNCVERAALYLLLAERIDPPTVRHLATIDTPAGRHTLPVEVGRPVVLDPRVPRNAAQAGLDLATGRRMPEALPDAVAWVCRTASEPAARMPGGDRAIRNASRALGALTVGDPIAPDDREAVATVLALARREADRWGVAAQAARAVVGRVERALIERPPARNLRIDLDPSGLARAVARIGSRALSAQLGALGLSPTVLGVVESELRREGLTLGPLARLGR